MSFQFFAYEESFNVTWGTTIKDVLDILQDRTGKRGGFQINGVDQVSTHALSINNSYTFVPQKGNPPAGKFHVSYPCIIADRNLLLFLFIFLLLLFHLLLIFWCVLAYQFLCIESC